MNGVKEKASEEAFSINVVKPKQRNKSKKKHKRHKRDKIYKINKRHKSEQGKGESKGKEEATEPKDKAKRIG